MKKNDKKAGFSKIPEVKRKEFKKKMCKNVGQKNYHVCCRILFSNFCPALLTLLYFLRLMTGQAFLTIAAVVSLLGF